MIFSLEIFIFIIEILNDTREEENITNMFHHF